MNFTPTENRSKKVGTTKMLKNVYVHIVQFVKLVFLEVIQTCANFKKHEHDRVTHIIASLNEKEIG